MTAALIAFQSEQRKKASEDYEKAIPDAEILLPTPEITTSPVSEIDTSNWKTYTFERKLIFKYPPNYIVHEQTKDTVLLSPDEVLTSDSDSIAIDVRDIVIYKDLDKATLESKKGLTDVKEENIDTGVLITGKVWDISKTISQEITIAVMETKLGVITPNYAGRKEGVSTFRQILSTFEFTN